MRKEIENNITYLTPRTKKLVERKMIENKTRLQKLSRFVGSTGADTDRWHSELFRTLQDDLAIGHAVSQVTKITEGKIVLIEPNKDDTVGLGSSIIVEFSSKKGRQNILTIVSPLDMVVEDTPLSWISSESPVGKALVGKKAGEEVYVDIPKGKTTLKILDVFPANDLDGEEKID